MKKHRTEFDAFGKIHVPANSLFGAHTQRAIRNFPIESQRSIGSFSDLVISLLLIKKACTITNKNIGELAETKANAIISSIDHLLANVPKHEFPIHYLHGGGGTSANMNVNEVIANLAEEKLGGKRGKYKKIHPIDHVNLNQSTNDVYPTACHMAIIRMWPKLRTSLYELESELIQTSHENIQLRRLARTCYQDAVDITFDDFLSGYTSFTRRNSERIAASVSKLYEINLGGTIIGRKSDVPREYFDNIIASLQFVTGNSDYFRSDNLFDFYQNADDLITISSTLEVLARGLLKISQDIRVLSSGPEAGLNEISIPAVQTGSSAMPGKINPVIPEFLIQICFRVIGNHAMCANTLNHGELDLNVWESSMVFSILESMELLKTGVESLAQKCISGLKINIEKNERNANSVIPLLTRLSQKYGYSMISEICSNANFELDEIRRQLRMMDLKL